jgi:hypothetical protein
MKMFWKKKDNDPNAEKLPSPKGIVEPLGMHLIVAMKQNPDWVWSLRSAFRPKPEDANLLDFRVFDGKKAATQNIQIINFNTLTDHPDLILFEGVFNKRTAEVRIIKNQTESV